MPARFSLNLIGHYRDHSDLTTQQVVEPARKEPRPGKTRIAADFVRIAKGASNPLRDGIGKLWMSSPDVS